jgi:cytochrome c-type biogenesis protein CcmH
LPGLAAALEPGEMLSDPVLESRAREISRHLRCLVCQNESIDDSSAPIAHDLRVLVRERLTAGDSDQQIYNFLSQRFGEFVLLRPPVRPGTWLLWFGPSLLLVVGAIGTLLWLRSRQHAPPAQALSVQERAELAQILRDRRTKER